MKPLPTSRCVPLLLWFLVAATRTTPAATFVVTSTQDRLPTNAVDFVPGTLRGAILRANASPDRDIIAFVPALLSAATPNRIQLVAPLPYVTHPIELDASPVRRTALEMTNEVVTPTVPGPLPGDPWGLQPPSIEITPAAAPMMDDGLRLTDNSVVRGIALFGFLRQLAVTGRSNLVESCYAGCTSAGDPGALHESAVGISVSGEFNRVTHCTVSGNGSHGIVVEFANNCEVLDNFVGPLRDGRVLGNLGAGIAIDNARTNVIGRAPFRGNHITGNFRGGIVLGSQFPDFSTRGTLIEANVIGLSLDGQADAEEGPVGNGSHGIVLNQQRQITVRGNQIHASHGDGVLLIGSSARDNRIDGNYIGGRGSGSGVHVFLGAQNVITNNEIEANLGNGVHLESASANQVVDNLLRGNWQAGVYLQGPDNAFSQASDNLVRGNETTANGGPGIVQHGNARQNRFFENAIFDNGGLGIDLGGTNEFQPVFSRIYDSMFTNSFSRGDGPNYIRNDNFQPYQQGVVLTNVTSSNSVVRAGGYFRTPPDELLVAGGLYLLHFYASSTGDVSGYGEGRNLAGAFLVGPIPSFNANTNFVAVFTNATLAEGDLITATVTRTNNAISANQTSEFSNVRPLRARAPVSVGDRVTTSEDQAVEFAVKDNDFTLDGSPVTVESVDVDAPGFGFGPLLGSATLLPDQRIRFVPATNVNRATIPGPVRIRHVIRDGRGLKTTGIAEVTILPVNDPPVALPDLATTRTDTPVTIPVRGNDTDVDGDRLAITTTTPPSHGTVSNEAGRTLTYTPAPGFVGVDTFSYGISDSAGGSDNATVTVLVRNAAVSTDLALIRIPWPPPQTVSTGAPVRFNMSVTNAGSLDAPGVVLEVRLSPHARGLSSSGSQGSSTRTGNLVRFDLGLIPSGSSASSTVEVAADAPGVIQGNARVLSLVGDAFPGNDRATATVSVVDGREPALGIVHLGDRIRLSWAASGGSHWPEYRRDVHDGTPWRRLSGRTVHLGDRVQMDVMDALLVDDPFVVFRLSRR